MLAKSVKTAYGLLSQICMIILQEPKRIRMANWFTRVKDLPQEAVPACGTVGCIAGWVVALADPQLAESHMRGHGCPAFTAMTTMGLDNNQYLELFLPVGLCNDLAQGTIEHARAVVAHIQEFQKTYHVQLKATKIKAYSDRGSR